MILRTVCLLAGCLLVSACTDSRPSTQSTSPGTAVVLPTGGPTSGSPTTPAVSTSAAWFTDRAAESGLQFQHANGASRQYFYPEILPPGVALFDYDGDGDLDVFVVQGTALGAPGGGAASTVAAPAAAGPASGQLFRNDLTVQADGTRTLRFTNVTAASGITTHGYGMGVATGDIDNDGDVDLYVTSFGANQLFRNNGDGSFADVTRDSGTANQPGGFTVSAAFVDYDRDGLLDLYVSNNTNYALTNTTVCPNPAGTPDYCPPQIYGGRADRLLHNLGKGRFADVSAKALPGLKASPALGVATADFNGDGWLDIYVANDGEDDFLWLNQQNGTFRDAGLAAGVAVTAEGKPEASMGVDAGDFDNDGDEDVIVAELTGQGSNLFVNDGQGRFRDASAASGIGAQSQPYTGWGTGWIDYDNDGWLDILTVNGTIIELAAQKGQPFPYAQRKVLFRNLGNGRFDEVGGQAGAAFALSESGRGAAFGDIDNDGDVDVVVGNDSGPLRLFINDIGSRQHWLGLRLLDGRGRDALGARVQVTRDGAPALWRRARADGSYGSANDPRVLVGLGSATTVPVVMVVWPDGTRERWRGVSIDRWTTLRQGTGEKG